MNIVATHKRGTVVGVVFALGIAGLAVWRVSLHRQTDPGRPRGAPSVAVEVEPLRRGMIRDERGFTGSLEPRARYVVAPKISGRLERIAVRIGDPVRSGQVVARLDDAELSLQVEQARAAWDVARATLEQQNTALALAEREMERVRSLRERGIASEAEWDAVDTEYQSAGARIRVAQAQFQERESALRAAEVRLSYTRIHAPENGDDHVWVVEARYVDEGAMLAANTPMLSVVDIGALTGVIQLIERDYASMHTGRTARLTTDAFPGESFTGRVARIAPALRASSRAARVEIDVPNRPPRLRPGMFVRVLIEFARRQDAVLAPRAALIAHEGREGLFLADRDTGIARFVAVETGIRSDERVEIIAPDLAGDVVTLGRHLLWDGQAVSIREPPAPPQETAGP